MRQKLRVCLVTSSHVASNPRLVKEADALAAAGLDVRVVAADVTAAVRPLDQTIFAAATWRTTLVARGGALSWNLRAFKRKAARMLCRFTPLCTPGMAVIALNQLTPRLAAAASREPADIFIAHTLPALPAAAQAAKRHAAKLGFDAEDFHSGELDQRLYPLEGRLSETIEAAFLPGCAHLTAASPRIAEAYRQRYGAEMTVLLNVFPLSEAPEKPKPVGDGQPRLYWFSQTLGPDRGLEAMLKVLAAMQTPAELHLRGSPLPGYRDALRALARDLGVLPRIHFLPPAPPAEMAKLASECSLGLSLESDQPENRALCLTNKIFTYLLAGIPVVLSRTPAQAELAVELGEAALLVDLQDAAGTAARLDALLGDGESLARACTAAWRLGQARYNWDREQQTLLGKINAVLKS